MPNHPNPTLRLTIARLARRMRSQRARDDISDGQLAVLFGLLQHGPLSIGELSTRERVTPPSMNRIVNAIEDAGFVSRGSSPDDGRKVIVTLTDAGLEITQETLRRRDAWFAQRLSQLAPEKLAILRAAEPVLRELAEE
ncbi:MarR family winged helix-turn-helix transcriptional regulator [Salinibacterium hongtaonis]|uniref:MarR family transcriptional regulator n=1 Tax=Homoserinimonas hongtaonis TaxID=2079791 RepID=A0A2U1T238_9MICO|nr:MarR family transcriptional regulator [Salinibacterium hongtaonis]AWB88204.1 MarR family transcriptional regulator [Salinibacterium hongtaonis]PWB97942.1 MarR family transcriptional regulator [Salinibacterium hongtaonis]